MAVLILGDSFSTQGGGNASTQGSSASWVTTTPSSAFGNGYTSGGVTGAPYCSLSPNDNEGMIPTLFRDLLAGGITTSGNVHIGTAGDNWLNQDGQLQSYISANPSKEFDSVVIHLGVNSVIPSTVAQGVYGPQFEGLMRTIVSRWPRVFVVHAACNTTNNDASYTGGIYQSKVDEINTYLQAKAAQYPYFYYSDTLTATGGHTINVANWQPAPNIHVNSTGSNLIGTQIAIDYIAAKADRETNMAIFGNDGSGLGTSTPTDSRSMISSRIGSTHDGFVASNLFLTADGTEQVISGGVYVQNLSAADVTIRLNLYVAVSAGAGTRWSPVGQAVAASSDPIVVTAAESSWGVKTLTFSTPFQPTAGQVIICAAEIDSGNLNLGSEASSGAYSYEHTTAEGGDPWGGSEGTASTRDFYIWFETEDIPTGAPTLTTPYPIGTNNGPLFSVTFSGTTSQIEAANYLDGNAGWASLLKTNDVVVINCSNATKMYNVTVDKIQRTITLSTGLTIA